MTAPQSTPELSREQIATPLTDAAKVHTIDFFGGFATDEEYWAPATLAISIERQLIKAQTDLAEAVTFIRVLGEELVIAGYPGGDRTVILANVRALTAELSRKQEMTKAAIHYVDISKSARSQFISENGRHGKSPWAELCDAVAAARAEIEEGK